MKMDSGNTYDLFEHCNRRTNKEATVVLEWVISSENRNHYLNCTTSKARQNGIESNGSNWDRHKYGKRPEKVSNYGDQA